jgi:hypothetical protein
VELESAVIQSTVLYSFVGLVLYSVTRNKSVGGYDTAKQSTRDKKKEDTIETTMIQKLYSYLKVIFSNVYVHSCFTSTFATNSWSPPNADIPVRRLALRSIVIPPHLL